MKGRDVLASCLRWHGMLTYEDKRTRRVFFAIQLILSATLTFTQMGFADMGLLENYYFYAILLLAPIATVALVLGTPAATLLGALAGLILQMHAHLMPMSFFEYVLVNPFTSVCLFTLGGLLQGTLFALFLRKPRTPGKEFVALAIPCFIVSWVCVTVIGVYAQYVMQTGITSGVSLTALRELVRSQEHRLLRNAAMIFVGKIPHVVIGAVLTSAFCMGVYRIVQRASNAQRVFSVRVVFGAWLFNAIATVAMVATVICFLSITGRRMEQAEQDMQSESNFLDIQLTGTDEKSAFFADVFARLEIPVDKLSGDMQKELVEAIAPYSRLLDGYTEDGTGIVFVTSALFPEDEYVFMTDSDRFPVDGELADLVDEEIMSAIETSISTGSMQRAYLGGIDNDPSMESSVGLTTKIVYVFAKEYQNVTAPGKIVIIKPDDLVFADRLDAMVQMLLVIATIASVVYGLVFWLLKDVVVRHIDTTNEALARVTGGDLDARVAVDGPTEFRSLSTGINTTVDALNNWIHEAEARIDAELAAARTIQEAALPQKFPPFPHIGVFDVFASMDPAKEVGGDFYDFFLIGDSDARQGRLGFLIADVSDKGIPAALFMMKAKALLRDTIVQDQSLSEAVEHTNAQLCENNGSCMFVTAWIGMLTYGEGGCRSIEYVNAGHNAPLYWHKGEGWSWLQETAGPPLGLAEMPYPSETLSCGRDDALFLYTDGVTEATSVDVELYGEERLENLLRTCDEPQAEELARTVRTDVGLFATDAVQSDDITILVLKLH